VGRRRSIETAPRWGDTEESPVAVALPYDFDTMRLPRKILSVMVWGSALMVFFALVMLSKVARWPPAPFPLAAVLLGMGRPQIHHNLGWTRQGRDQPGCCS